MNYRHSFHAGNFADLVKHAIVLALVERMQAAGGPLEAVDLERAETVLVWRQHGAVRQRLLTGGELALLAAFAAQQPLAEAVDAAGRRDSTFDFATALAKLLSGGVLIDPT